MSWTLKSGRTIYGFCAPEESVEEIAHLELDYRQHEGDSLFKNPLTRNERQEIADAVKACWDRWTETGKP